MNRFSTAVTGFLLAGTLLNAGDALAQDARVVAPAVRQNTSEPLRQIAMPSVSKANKAPYQIPNKGFKFDVRGNNTADKTGFIDPVLQVQAGTLAPSVYANFDGSSDDDNAAVIGFRVVPPDTDGDVGPNHYVQWINSITEIFDKNGNSLFGPAAGNVYFQGLGGDCEADNDGDPIVLYDEEADRWLVSQFSVAASPYSMCVAISATPDPLGSYHQYEFSFGTDFPDYPKLGIWGDSYTMTTRDFANGFAFAGLSAVALDRNAMLNGQPATMVRFGNAFGGTSIDGYLPADADGPISGPALFGGHGDDDDTTFELWQLNVDWNNPGAATFSSIPGVTVPVFDGVVPSVNQPNGQLLDDHSFFTMHRLQVRDFGTHTAMVANHTVETQPNTAGIRWYEFRNTGGNWTLHQSGTYSPDADDRWMGSIAINANGDIALGYSRSSSALFPSIYMTGQTADQSGTGIMNVAETLLHAGGGSQSGASRWGDYSMMSVDPVDNRFWYTTEYYAETGSFDFNTRIASFDLGSTGGGGNNPPVASFTSSCTLLSCSFTDASVDSDGSIASWSWNFGDGATTTSQSPSHTYAANGTYTVSLTVTDDAGATGSTSQSVTVNDGTVTATMSIAAIGIDAIRVTGERGRFAEATVSVIDSEGAPVSGVSVTGEFYGFIDEAGKGPELTNGSGEAVFVSDANGSRRRILEETFFCVTSVTGAGLTYEPGDNADPTFDCAGAPNAPSLSAGELAASADEMPADFGLAQNYPNPFNPTTIIGYSVPEGSDVTVQVFNMLGQEVATLASGYHDAGRYEVAFNANDLSAGIYIYTIKAGSIAITKRMTLLK